MHEKSVSRGRNLVHSNERYRNSQNSLGDVLLDLIHWAKADGIDWESELDWAKQAYQEDKRAERNAEECIREN